MNWEKIKVAQYYKIMDIIKEENDPYVLNAELIRCIWGVNVEDIPYVRLHQYCKEMEFLKEPYKPKAPKKEYDINGVIYRPVLDVSKVTTAQYIDFQECTKRNAYKELLNCLFIKDGCNYGECADDFLWENLTLDVYSDVLFFFLELLKRLMIDTLNSSVKMMKKELKKVKDKTARIAMLRKIVEAKVTILRLNEGDYGQLI